MTFDYKNMSYGVERLFRGLEEKSDPKEFAIEVFEWIATRYLADSTDSQMQEAAAIAAIHLRALERDSDYPEGK